ncbi:MAG TPA: methionyl-tRNA formyltransferase [Nocardioidaceae bacterium]|nr:methionyl-tRNA formyltransferase [Nocardioidaceae bacterium]
MSSEARSTEPRSRVLLLGLGPTTGSALESLLGRFEVVALVRDDEDDVTHRAREAGVPVIPDPRPSGLGALIEQTCPDCVVVSSYDRIIGPDLLALVPFINVHYAPLPRYRGRANVNWAIINGEREVAVTVHCVVPDLDAGPVLAQQLIPLEPDDDVTSVYARLNDLQAALLPAAVARRLSGDEGEPQAEGEATYGCTRLPEDGEIDWTWSTARIHALVRALAPPYPGAFTYAGLQRLWVVEAAPAPSPLRYEGRVPGRVVGRSATKGWVEVLTGDSVLRLNRLRLQDGQVVPAAAVVAGTHATLGLRTWDLVERLVELEAKLVGDR